MIVDKARDRERRRCQEEEILGEETVTKRGSEDERRTRTIHTLITSLLASIILGVCEHVSRASGDKRTETRGCQI